MGSCGISTKTTNTIVVNNSKQPQSSIPNNEEQINNQESERSGNPSNRIEKKKSINEDKFNDLEEYENEFSGEGIKKMKAYKWNAPFDLLYKLRLDFWMSKKDNKSIWAAIKQSCETDHLSALGFLQSVGLQPIGGCMNQLIDNNDNIFVVPNYCINDPLYKKEVKQIDLTEAEVIHIQIVDIFNPSKSTTVKVPTNINCLELKKCFGKAKNIDLEKNKIRVLFQGSEILDEHVLAQHNIVNNSKVQFVVQQLLLEKESEEDENLDLNENKN